MFKTIAAIAILLAIVSYPVKIVHQQADAAKIVESTTNERSAVTLKQHLETPSISLKPIRQWKVTQYNNFVNQQYPLLLLSTPLHLLSQIAKFLPGILSIELYTQDILFLADFLHKLIIAH